MFSKPGKYQINKLVKTKKTPIEMYPISEFKKLRISLMKSAYILLCYNERSKVRNTYGMQKPKIVKILNFKF